MNIKDICVTVLNKTQKHLPDILVVAGVAGVITGTVVACKETKKADPILEEHKETMKLIEEKEISEEYTEKDQRKDIAKARVGVGFKFAKLYFPAGLIMGGSIACILGSHHILTKRNIALGAAYATLDTAFKEYREAIVEKFGEEVDKEARFAIKAKKMKGKNGEPDTVKYEMTEKTESSKTWSEYSFYFDPTSELWEDDAEYNKMTLKNLEDLWNRRLQEVGHVYLNEVLDSLKIPRTKAGQVVGWVYRKDNPIGDNRIDFGVVDLHNTAKREFMNGYEKVILLDFNVDGNILDLM